MFTVYFFQPIITFYATLLFSTQNDIPLKSCCKISKSQSSTNTLFASVYFCFAKFCCFDVSAFFFAPFFSFALFLQFSYLLFSSFFSCFVRRFPCPEITQREAENFQAIEGCASKLDVVLVFLWWGINKHVYQMHASSALRVAGGIPRLVNNLGDRI